MEMEREEHGIGYKDWKEREVSQTNSKWADALMCLKKTFLPRWNLSLPFLYSFSWKIFCAKVFCTGYESQRYYGQDLFFFYKKKKKKSKQQKSYKNQIRHNILLLEIVGENVHTHINNKHNKLHNKKTVLSIKKIIYYCAFNRICLSGSS